jgi:hypothetical protein
MSGMALLPNRYNRNERAGAMISPGFGGDLRRSCSIRRHCDHFAFVLPGKSARSPLANHPDYFLALKGYPCRSENKKNAAASATVKTTGPHRNTMRPPTTAANIAEGSQTKAKPKQKTIGGDTVDVGHNERQNAANPAQHNTDFEITLIAGPAHGIVFPNAPFCALQSSASGGPEIDQPASAICGRRQYCVREMAWQIRADPAG